jgi:hypothetical protein
LIARLIQFKCTKYFRDDLTLVLVDAQSVSIIIQNHSQRLEKAVSYYSKNSLVDCSVRICEFKSRSSQRIFRWSIAVSK